jgi:hypothetical protein
VAQAAASAASIVPAVRAENVAATEVVTEAATEVVTAAEIAARVEIVVATAAKDLGLEADAPSKAAPSTSNSRS